MRCRSAASDGSVAKASRTGRGVDAVMVSAKLASRAQRPDQEGGRAAERRERNLAEGGALHERRGGQRNRPQQFAGPEHVALGTEHEVGDGDAPLPPVGRPDGADTVERCGE